MSVLKNSIRRIVAKHLNVKERRIDVDIVTALPYSTESIQAVEQTLKNQNLEGLKNIDNKQSESNPDSVIVCRCSVKDNELYVALLLDTEELYEPITLLKLIPLK